jgi:hypothetical protein
VERHVVAGPKTPRYPSSSRKTTGFACIKPIGLDRNWKKLWQIWNQRQKCRRRNAAIAGEKETSRGLASGDKPMSAVIPLRKPPPKPKQDEPAEFLELLERIAKSIKSK